MSSDLIKVGQLEIRYLVDGSKSGGLGVFELVVPPGANVPPPHSHRHNEEFFYVVEGSLGYSVDGESRELAPGEWMSTPRGSVHAFRNTGTQTARALVVLTPDIGAQYFRDVAEVVNAGGPPDRAKLLDVMSRYGLAAAAPPPAAASAPRAGA
ncbi:MAG: cupin domain-containing protein [Burkholderiaceae bacterium]|nr:cupin domain-containing protein [Burkholderiaceae bacterium]